MRLPQQISVYSAAECRRRPGLGIAKIRSGSASVILSCYRICQRRSRIRIVRVLQIHRFVLFLSQTCFQQPEERTPPSLPHNWGSNAVKGAIFSASSVIIIAVLQFQGVLGGREFCRSAGPRANEWGRGHRIPLILSRVANFHSAFRGPKGILYDMRY